MYARIVTVVAAATAALLVPAASAQADVCVHVDERNLSVSVGTRLESAVHANQNVVDTRPINACLPF